MAKATLAIIGARLDGQAGVVFDIFSLGTEFEVVKFFDRTLELKGSILKGIPVQSDIFQITDKDFDSIDFFHIAIGNNKARADIFNFLKTKGAKFANCIHPSAVISKTALMGEGVFIGANAVVQNDVTIGNVCILNSSSVIEHNNKIGDAVQVAPNATTGGRVVLEDLVFLGISSIILPDLHIGTGAFIGAGAIITKDVPENNVMIGNAAVSHKKNIYVENESITSREK